MSQTKRQSRRGEAAAGEDRSYTYEEYLREFAPDRINRKDGGSSESFGERLAKETIEILRDGKVASH